MRRRMASNASRGRFEDGSRGGNHFSLSALSVMPYDNREKPPSREERQAKAEARRWDAEQALNERRKADDAFRANFERLRAERLAREAIRR